MTSEKTTPAPTEDAIHDIRDYTFNYRDDFSRKPIAEKMIDLLSANIEVSPMVIDGGWGTGKTEFCCKLINLMKDKDTHHVIYINAFQADHVNEPLLTVLAEVVELIPTEKRKAFIKKALPMLRFGLKTAGKAIFAHVFKQDAGDVKDELDGVLKTATNEAIDASVEAILNDHVEANKNLKTLQKALEDTAKTKPIVLFVDELDRCKPDFAIHMLEVIKHVFDVKGVQFVLVCSTQQLKASINHCYGAAVDAQRYLDKFLKFTFALPKHIGKDKSVNVSIQHYINLIQASHVLNSSFSIASNDSIFIFVQHVIKVQRCSLREIETFVRYLEIYQIITKNEGFSKETSLAYTLLRLTGILLFCFKQELVGAMIDGKLDAKELGAFFEEEGITSSEKEMIHFEPHQIILAVLTQECYKNSELFIVADERTREYLENTINRVFSPPHYRQRPKGYSQVVIDTVQTLNLGKIS